MNACCVDYVECRATRNGRTRRRMYSRSSLGRRSSPPNPTGAVRPRPARAVLRHVVASRTTNKSRPYGRYKRHAHSHPRSVAASRRGGAWRQRPRWRTWTCCWRSRRVPVASDGGAAARLQRQRLAPPRRPYASAAAAARCARLCTTAHAEALCVPQASSVLQTRSALGAALPAACDDVWLLRYCLSFPILDERGAHPGRRGEAERCSDIPEVPRRGTP